MIAEINQRSREIMRLIVEAYTETGSAIGSRTLARRLELPLSPATVRNAMADLDVYVQQQHLPIDEWLGLLT